MKKQIEQTVKFNVVAGKVPMSDTTDRSKLDLHLGLIEEELKELGMASLSGKGDKVEMLDALGDILVTVFGFAYNYGLDKVLPEAYHRIHVSNMSKFCKTEEEAIQSVEKYTSQNIETYYKKVKGFYVIYRKSDNKILKGINYRKVMLHDLV